MSLYVVLYVNCLFKYMYRIVFLFNNLNCVFVNLNRRFKNLKNVRYRCLFYIFVYKKVKLVLF